MKKTQPTLVTIDKKIDALAKSVDSKIGSLTKIVENLAIATKKGFDDTATKVELRAVEERIDGVEVRLTEVEKSTGRIERGLNNRLDRVEDTVLVLKTHAGVR
ncbi:MAG: hypothetical protein UY50_C0031G0024 [Parcubacteria group bacterium GW2011_GWA2_49_9]|nr:MAG: hypothetical protein UY50_C0031G0024 [Parcubacteria group bacterium GW2011_GWA2_49_9]